MYEALYAQNRGLLNRLARQYEGACRLDRAVSVEDLMQAGFFALVQAEQSFDPAQGKTWAAWAAWYVRREYEKLLGLRDGRFIRADTGAQTLDRPVSGMDESGATLKDMLADDSLPDADAALLRRELADGVRAAVDRLEDEGQRRAVRLMQLEARSARAAAADMGLTPAQVRRLCEQALTHLHGDARLRALADLDDRTRFHAHKGVRAFNQDWTSVTEAAALWRVEQRERMGI